MPAESTLVVGTIAFPLGSARGISAQCAPIAQRAIFRRTVNGELMFLGEPQYDLWGVSLSVSDQRAASDALALGSVHVVDLPVWWNHPNGGTPRRPYVPGSTYVEGTNTHYRPRMTMMVTGYQEQHDEWGAIVGWTLALEELKPAEVVP